MAPVSRRRTVRTTSATSVLAAWMFAILALTAPDDVAAATTLSATCTVNLRAGPSTTDRIRTAIPKGTPVTVEATVAGSGWRVSCAGARVAGNQWHEISAIAGQPVHATLGVPSVYAVAGLFTGNAAPAPQPAPGAVTEGVDVSHWQGAIDWAAVGAAGKRFAFIKASEGATFVDPYFATNRAGAEAAGLYVGAYHFGRPYTEPGDAVGEADHFVDTAAIHYGNLLPVLDLEVTNGLAPAELQAWTRAFLERVYERTGARAILYVSPTFWANNMGDTSWFADNGYRVLWVAHWTDSGPPTTPADNWGGEGWTFWQYTSSGAVPGIDGRVDLNRYNGTDFTEVLVP